MKLGTWWVSAGVVAAVLATAIGGRAEAILSYQHMLDDREPGE